ncbi:uncharacterized protein LOC111089703 [Limulus polyphemus]|uniref:Uncharacterized protein LOC111089703 n=1 Tax=Limulus polyphemus TaxID=6850 RepID=A0ABM1TR54_LIMPO|nr:uncharacterized protein LOC111089703 [Limulus polyphemus]
MSSDESQDSSPQHRNTSRGARKKRYSLVRLSHEQDDSFTEIRTSKKREDDGPLQVKDVRHWIHRIRHALRTVRLSKSRRKHRYDSITTSYVKTQHEFFSQRKMAR